MKKRCSFVSNSSSSSFLVPHRIEGIHGISCVKLPKEIWKAIERNHIEWDGSRFDMSCSDEWWLTDMVSDCSEFYSDVSEIPNAISYLEGNDQPYGCYEDDGEKNYIVFKKDRQEFYVLLSDFVGSDGSDEIPESVNLRKKARRILEDKTLNKTQKINAMKAMFDF